MLHQPVVPDIPFLLIQDQVANYPYIFRICSISSSHLCIVLLSL